MTPTEPDVTTTQAKGEVQALLWHMYVEDRWAHTGDEVKRLAAAIWWQKELDRLRTQRLEIV